MNCVEEQAPSRPPPESEVVGRLLEEETEATRQPTEHGGGSGADPPDRTMQEVFGRSSSEGGSEGGSEGDDEGDDLDRDERLARVAEIAEQRESGQCPYRYSFALVDKLSFILVSCQITNMIFSGYGGTFSVIQRESWTHGLL